MKYLRIVGKTFYDAIRVRFFLLREWIIHIARYSFRRPTYLFLDCMLVLSYFFKSPYRIIHEWDETHKELVGPYGELPISEMERIYAILLKDKKILTFYDFGSGRGRIALWAALCKGWTSYAIESVTPFCKKLENLIHRFSLNNIKVIQGDYSLVSLKNCDLVMINPGELESLQEEILIKTLSSLKHGSYVLSIGFTLSSPLYEVEGLMPLTCPWGDEFAVLQKKKLS